MLFEKDEKLDKCMFLTEKDGKFCSCKALRVTGCPKNCKFKKTDWEFAGDAERAANSLRERGLIPVIKTSKDGRDNIMSVEKIR